MISNAVQQNGLSLKSNTRVENCVVLRVGLENKNWEVFKYTISTYQSFQNHRRRRTKVALGFMIRWAFLLVFLGVMVGRTGAMCGDGILDVGEECDDANSIIGDGCEPDCRKTTSVYRMLAQETVQCGIRESASTNDSGLVLTMYIEIDKLPIMPLLGDPPYWYVLVSFAPFNTSYGTIRQPREKCSNTITDFTSSWEELFNLTEYIGSTFQEWNATSPFSNTYSVQYEEEFLLSELTDSAVCCRAPNVPAFSTTNTGSEFIYEGTVYISVHVPFDPGTEVAGSLMLYEHQCHVETTITMSSTVGTGEYGVYMSY